MAHQIDLSPAKIAMIAYAIHNTGDNRMFNHSMITYEDWLAAAERMARQTPATDSADDEPVTSR